MDDWHENNWFAIHAKPRQESLAAARVANLDPDVFLPCVKQSKSVCGVSRWVTQSQRLFQGYFFARFVTVVSIDSVRFSYSVLRVVGNRPVPDSFGGRNRLQHP